MTWYDLKLFLSHSSGFTLDAWHVVLGVCLQLIIARLTKRGVASPIPWSAVLIIEMLNEIHDLRLEQWPELAIQYGESAKDVLLTMLLPTVLLLTARNAPSLFQPLPARIRPAAPGVHKRAD